MEQRKFKVNHCYLAHGALVDGGGMLGCSPPAPASAVLTLLLLLLAHGALPIGISAPGIPPPAASAAHGARIMGATAPMGGTAPNGTAAVAVVRKVVCVGGAGGAAPDAFHVALNKCSPNVKCCTEKAGQEQINEEVSKGRNRTLPFKSMSISSHPDNFRYEINTNM